MNDFAECLEGPLADLPRIAHVGIAVPDKVLTIPIVVAFVVSVLHFVTLYRARVLARWASVLLALASVGLSLIYGTTGISNWLIW